MTPATHRRVRAAVLALPERERQEHLAALSWAAQLLEHVWLECTAPDCTEPDHVSLLTQPARVTGPT